MGAPHIVFYGHFGVGNLGNDTTLEAALYHTKRLYPTATITCVCRGPRVIAARFGVAALPVDVSEDRTPGESAQPEPNKVVRLLTRAVDELDFWVRRTLWFRTVDHFIVVGTGALYDGTAPPWNMPYDLFKWCRAAKLGGAKVSFMSVGAGPINHPASRALMLNALRGAAYRSYRDGASFAYLQSIGFDTKADQLYPDVVFSLPIPADCTAPPNLEQPQRIGLGVIGYYGPSHDTVGGKPIYQAYVGKLKEFVQWLLAQGYSVRLLTGDLENDRQPADELLAFVRSQGLSEWQTRIIAEPIATVDDLSRQIAQTDLVIASRFHNLIGALMLGRPVISVGFHAKNDALMAEMGLQAYCQHIEQLDVARLITQFQTLLTELKPTAQRIQQKNTQYRQLLAEQYACVLSSATAKVPVLSTVS
jgi:polysaccharide pyruvyl transferase WcaK-like protein